MFCRLNDSYWGELDGKGDTLVSLREVPRPSGAKYGAVQIFSADAIQRMFGIELPRGDYQYYFDEDVLAFRLAPKKRSLFFPRTNPNFEFMAREKAERFWHQSLVTVLERLSEPHIEISQILDCLRAYTYSDHFSLWLFNPDTNYFTLQSASFHSEKEYVVKDDPATTLTETIISKHPYFSKPLNPGVLNSAALVGIQTVNRFYINFSSRIEETGAESDLIAVLSFYSRHGKFSFNLMTQRLISHIVQLRLTNEFSIYASWYNELVRDLTERYVPGRLSEYLNSFVAKITKTLGFEAASVFFADANQNGALVLRAVSEYGNNIVKAPAPVYPLSINAKTVRVYNENELGFSYEISLDSQNSHIFSERTEHLPKNWIGVPIRRGGASPIGVLRAKNRLRGIAVDAFNKADVDILRNLAAIIAYLYDAESQYLATQRESEEQLKKRQQEYEQLSEFLRTYRHEIKSPLIVITEAATLLKLALEQEKLITGGELPKKVREICDDLDMVGSRLTFIANILTFDPSELVKEIKETNPFFEIVTPVLAFMRLYAKNRGKDILVDKDSLRLASVECDAISASMVFHILLDNAVKYTPKGGFIKVYGMTIRDCCSIVVENRGLPILESDLPHLFDKYYRGKAPTEQKTEGSGIGLYLAREIMKINGGSILLRSQNNPTSFEARFKQYHL